MALVTVDCCSWILCSCPWPPQWHVTPYLLTCVASTACSTHMPRRPLVARGHQSRAGFISVSPTLLLCDRSPLLDRCHFREDGLVPTSFHKINFFLTSSSCIYLIVPDGYQDIVPLSTSYQEVKAFATFKTFKKVGQRYRLA